jgi:hypothetical protein
MRSKSCSGEFTLTRYTEVCQTAFTVMKLIVTMLIAGVSAWSQTQSLEPLNHGRPMLDAHNCYPYEGQWTDRLDRALSAGLPVVIEQDLTWHVDRTTGKGRIAISHGTETRGDEPGLRDYFFDRVRPIVEQALAKNDKSNWPLLILHFDFKSEEVPLLRAVWDLLGEYESWITTAVKTADPNELSTLDRRPLLVLTEDSDRQEREFYGNVKVGSRLRVFGSAHTIGLRGKSKEERIRLAATAAPEQLLPAPATNYRRWWNNSWFEVEQGGQQQAGAWTPEDERRLRDLVYHAHRLGYWIRFYTLDGFGPDENRGWDQGYNFGSRAAAVARWKAAIAAGVDMIATDQYEELAAQLASSTR